MAVSGETDPRQASFREALACGDEATCRKILHHFVQGATTRSQAAECLITDAMRGIGQAWKAADLDVYQERRACGICLRLLEELRAELPLPPPDAPIAIGGTPEGDPYQLPSALVEFSLREMGWNAINLGSNIPLDSFLQASQDYDPDMVWMSVSSIPDWDEFAKTQNKLAEALGDDVPLFMGGRGLCDSVRPKLKYTAFCDSLENLLDLASLLRMRH